MILKASRTVGISLFILLLITGCGDAERERLAGLKDRIAFQYNAELNITRVEGEGLVLDTVQMFDLSKRISEGNRIIGVRIWDKEIDFEVVGVEKWEFTEGDEYMDIALDTDQEFLDTQAGRFRIRLSEEGPLVGESSGIFRKKLSFTPTKLGVLVEDEMNPGGFTEIEMTEPDIGFVELKIPSVFGEKQPPGGKRSRDGSSLAYSFPSDMTKLQGMTFTYFPTRGTYYFGSALMWILTRLAWMVLGVVLYVYWIKQREKAKLERMKPKKSPLNNLKKEQREPKPDIKNEWE